MGRIGPLQSSLDGEFSVALQSPFPFRVMDFHSVLGSSLFSVYCSVIFDKHRPP